MPKINIDELCEPIEVTVGEKDYTIKDISKETAKKMGGLGVKADAIQEDIKLQTTLISTAVLGGNIEEENKARAKLAELMKRAEDDDSTNEMSALMCEILGATKIDIDKLGMRKLMLLVTQVMRVISEEIEGKNALKVVAKK